MEERIIIRPNREVPGFSEYRDGWVISGLTETERNIIKALHGGYVMREGIWVYMIAENIQAVEQSVISAMERAKIPKPPHVPVRRCIHCGEKNPKGMFCPMSDDGQGPHEIEEG